MVTKARQKKLRSLITEAIRVLCKNGLDNDYNDEFTIEGLLGITLDNDCVFLVNINETIRNEDTEDDEDEQRVVEPKIRKSQANLAPSRRPNVASAPPSRVVTPRGTQQTPQSSGSAQQASAQKRKLEAPAPSTPSSSRQTTVSQPRTDDTYEPEPKQASLDTGTNEMDYLKSEAERENDARMEREEREQAATAMETGPEGRDDIVVVNPEESRIIRIPSKSDNSPQPIVIVPQPKPSKMQYKSNGHRGLQPLHISIPVPVQAVHIEQLFTRQEEDMIVGHMKHLFEIGWGLMNTSTPISLICSNYANYLKKTGSTTPHIPLYDKWYRDLKLRKPEINKYEIRQRRNSGRDDNDDIGQIVSTSQISLYYKKLSEKMRELELSKRPNDIYMVEETQIEIFESIGEKEIVTVSGCASCTGEVKPIMLTFKGKKQVTSRWTDGAAVGTKAFVTISGISSSSIMQKVLACYFREYSTTSASGYPDNPVLVMYDPRKGNVCPGVIEWAESKNIILFPFPPHFESLLEPLEPGSLTPFKAAYEEELAKMVDENPNFLAHKHNICAIVTKIYDIYVGSKNVIEAFIKLGIQVSKTKPKAK